MIYECRAFPIYVPQWYRASEFIDRHTTRYAIRNVCSVAIRNTTNANTNGNVMQVEFVLTFMNSAVDDIFIDFHRIAFHPRRHFSMNTSQS